MAVFGLFVVASRTLLIQRRGVAELLLMLWLHCVHGRDRRADALTTGDKELDMARQLGYSASKIMVGSFCGLAEKRRSDAGN